MKIKFIACLLLMISGASVFAEDPNIQTVKPRKKRAYVAAQPYRQPAAARWWNELPQPPRSVVGYLGIYDVGVYPLPFVVGADFRLTLPANPRIALRAGALYWTASGWGSGGYSSLFDLSVGGGYVWTVKRVEIEGGGRLGYDTFHVNSHFGGWEVFDRSGSSAVLGPYAAGSFKFTSEWSAGVEFRLPYYFKGGGLLLNEPYILTQGQYHF